MMTIRNEVLASKLLALNALLENPLPNDDAWSSDLLNALEMIYQLSLHLDAPVVAASRTKLSIAA